MKNAINVGAVFTGGFVAGFTVCLFSVFVVSPLLSEEAQETLSGMSEQYAGKSSPAVDDCHDWVAPVHLNKEDPWNTMKAINRPAPCPVKGFAIEELDPGNNFRRFYSLGFSEDIEDKTGVLPYMLAAHDWTLQTRPRRVYLDLGGNHFRTSVTWFSHYYPLDFTEYHVFEKEQSLFRLPAKNTLEAENLQAMDSKSLRTPGQKPLPIPNHILDRIKVYRKYVDVSDGKDRVNITRFIKEELGMSPEDVLIVKMDIEQFEWPILKAWLADEEMPKLVDELFVEVHYNHKTMKKFGWNSMKHARADTTDLFVDLRRAGFYCHPWP